MPTGKLDMVVCGAGTGGTVSGLAKKIKERCPTCKVNVLSVFADMLSATELVSSVQ